ncbi:MarR family winged helix-turn-helix transcriptional regulator [Rubeoparvulum massiliense]|uniref:MarR family winged helix-turn-helix transcriptional regulator n=1 Tax=Rubeoparvulum massiliense TaxID=1631346 RepID=UPI00065DFF76|nr:MarR family transcriptional regulator [Rubeoparvulum massiliense]
MSNITEEEVVELERLLRHISGIIKRKGREILNDFPITPPQFIALQWLDELGDTTIGDLSNKMYLAFSTTTDLIDRMEKNELVQRIRDEKDRRVVRIHLLPKGNEIIHQVLQARQAYLKGILQHFDRSEVDRLQVTLTQLYEEMSRE